MAHIIAINHQGQRLKACIGALLIGTTALFTASTAPASAQSAQRPGPLETYKDWVIGCDNIADCTAASLLAPDGSIAETFATLYIRRDAGPYGAIRMEIRLSDNHAGKADLLVDGVKYTASDISDTLITISDDGRASLLPAMLRGKAMQVQADGKIIGSISLNGLSAALRYMDAQQGRAGTVTALVATGKLVATSVKAAPLPPVVQHLLPEKQKKATSARLWQGERGQALAISGCAAEQTPESEAEITWLSDKEELVLIPCGHGAYNFSYVPLIATGAAGRRNFKPARFDYLPGWSEAGKISSLVNAVWDAQGAILSSYSKGRGIGDCGSTESYVWDGAVFHMIEKREMKECRGAWDWIRLWTAQAKPMEKSSKKSAK